MSTLARARDDHDGDMFTAIILDTSVVLSPLREPSENLAALRGFRERMEGWFADPIVAVTFDARVPQLWMGDALDDLRATARVLRGTGSAEANARLAVRQELRTRREHCEHVWRIVGEAPTATDRRAWARLDARVEHIVVPWGLPVDLDAIAETVVGFAPSRP